MRAESNGSHLGDGDNVIIRDAREHDGPRLRRLAGRDSATVPRGRLLVAERAGELVAALAVHGGGAIADPFRPSAAYVDLLELRARQLR